MQMLLGPAEISAWYTSLDRGGVVTLKSNDTQADNPARSAI